VGLIDIGCFVDVDCFAGVDFVVIADFVHAFSDRIEFAVETVAVIEVVVGFVDVDVSVLALALDIADLIAAPLAAAAAVASPFHSYLN